MDRTLRLLFRKALRDVRQSLVSFAACGLMIALAVTLLIAFAQGYNNLERSCESTYQRLKFQDLALELRRTAPLQVCQRLERIPGVKAVVGRPRVGVVLLTPDSRRQPSLDATLHGLPEGARPQVNDLHLDEGRYLGAHRGEILMETRFAHYHHFRVGDVIQINRFGRLHRFTVVGLVSSPEFIWYVRSRYDPRPAFRRWGVLFAGNRDLEALSGAGMREIQIRVEDPARRAEIAAEAKARLAEYLPLPPELREQQRSNALLIRDRRAFAAMAILFPLVFFSLSSAILFSTIWQLVSQQRRQVGILMVNGISDRKLLAHYLFLTLLVGLFGALIGVVPGWRLGRLTTELYADTLGLPFVETSPPWLVSCVAVLMAVVVALLSGWLATRRLLGLTASACLRPGVATVARDPFLERWFPPLGRMRYVYRLPLRNLFRQPIRSLVSILGIAFAVAQVLMVLALFDSQRLALNFMFDEVHRYDFQVELHLTDRSMLPPIERWTGVKRVEYALRRGAEVAGPRGYVSKSVLGLQQDSQLFRLHDQSKRPIQLLDGERLLMGPIPARQLQLQAMDPVELTLLSDEPEAPIFSYAADTRLLEVVEGPMVMTLKQLHRQHTATDSRLWPEAVNQIFMTVRPEARETVRRDLQRLPWVRSVVDIREVRQEVDDLLGLADSYKWLMFLFSALLAFAILTGTTTMNVMERAHELATMAVMGTRPGTLLKLLVVEILLLWAVALNLGIPAGYYLGNWILNHYQSDLIQLSMNLAPASCIYTALITLGICLAATVNALWGVLRIPLKEAMLNRTH